MLHASTLPRRMARRDNSVPLSRTRIPRIVLQDRLCSVHAAAAFLPPRPRLCAVNVKLTMSLAIGAGLLVSAHSVARRFSPGAGAVATRAVSNSLVVARGGVGMYPGPARQDQHGRGRAFSEPSLFLCVLVPDAVRRHKRVHARLRRALRCSTEPGHEGF